MCSCSVRQLNNWIVGIDLNYRNSSIRVGNGTDNIVVRNLQTEKISCMKYTFKNFTFLVGEAMGTRFTSSSSVNLGSRSSRP